MSFVIFDSFTINQPSTSLEIFVDSENSELGNRLHCICELAGSLFINLGFLSGGSFLRPVHGFKRSEEYRELANNPLNLLKCAPTNT
jgi:hypothetical protein